jgi:hypothetical protein
MREDCRAVSEVLARVSDSKSELFAAIPGRQDRGDQDIPQAGLRDENLAIE